MVREFCARAMRIAPLLLIAGSLGLAGCSGGLSRPKTVPVKGTVEFRGKPLADARVTFYGPGATMPAIGDTNESGEFVLSMYGKGDGAIVGENKVTVSMLAPSGAGAMVTPDPTKIAAGTAEVPSNPEIGQSKKESTALPKVYSDLVNTPLTWTVKPEGSTDVKLELK